MSDEVTALPSESLMANHYFTCPLIEALASCFWLKTTVLSTLLLKCFLSRVVVSVAGLLG